MPFILEALNGFANLFTDSTYPVRLFAFAGYAALLWAAYALFRRSRAGAFLRDRRACRMLATAGIASLAGLFVFGLSCQLYFMRAYDLPQRSVAIFISGNDLTGTRLAHTHFGKLALSGIGDTFHAAPENADDGAGLMPFVPAWIPGAMAALFLIALVSSALLFVSRFRETKGKNAAFAALYAVSAFIALDKAVDGGLWSDGALIAFASYVLLAAAPAERYRTFLAYAAFAYAWCVSILFATGFFVPVAMFAAYALRAGFLFALLMLLHAIAFDGGSVRFRRAAMAALGIFAAAFACVQAAPTFAYLAEHAAPGDAWITDRSSALPLPRAGTIGALSVYENIAPSRVSALVSRYRLPYWYRPVVTRAGACAAAGMTARETAYVLSPVPLAARADAAPSTLARATFAPAGKASSGWYRYAATVAVNPCAGRAPDILAGMIRLAGSDTAIAYGVSNYQQNTDFGDN